MNHTYSDQSTWIIVFVLFLLFWGLTSSSNSETQLSGPTPAPVSHLLVFSAATQWGLALQAGHWKGSVAVFCMLIVLIC